MEQVILSEEQKLKKHRQKMRLAKKCISYFFLSLIALIYVFPAYCLLVKSIMPDYQLMELPSLLPDYINLKPYTQIFSAEFLWYFKNTFIVCISNVLAVVFVSSFTAYGLSKVRMKGREVIFGIIMSTVLLPGTVTSIPLYLVYSKLGWTHSLLPLILPIWFGGGAMNVFLIRQFIRGIPNSYCEAAILDGASSFRIYWSIVLPLIKPILIYLAVNTFNARWNDFQGPLMYVSTHKANWTASLALYKLASKSNGNILANTQMAMGVIMMIPGVILFALFQKQLMEGVATVGLKG